MFFYFPSWPPALTSVVPSDLSLSLTLTFRRGVFLAQFSVHGSCFVALSRLARVNASLTVDAAAAGGAAGCGCGAAPVVPTAAL